MPRPFEVRKEIEVAATPEQVWEAIATGPGIDGWFLGVGNEVEPREGGTVRLDFGGASGVSTVTAWDPPRRFAHNSEVASDGSLHAFEFVVEGRAGGTALVRIVHSGFLGGDWDEEYDALNEGDFMYLHLMAQYVTHFRGLAATPISVWRDENVERVTAMAGFRTALGLTEPVTEGDQVRFNAEGLGSIVGTVDFLSPGIIGIRSDDALYRFLHAPGRSLFLGHHIYRPGLPAAEAKAAWAAWLDRAFD